jgi:hypothetical protein
LEKRSGEKTILSQVMREADGFTVEQAIILDAELNLRDDQGQVKDYVNYFKASGTTKKEANLRGLLSKSKGRRAYTIATDGSDELITAHRNDTITFKATANGEGEIGNGRTESVSSSLS